MKRRIAGFLFLIIISLLFLKCDGGIAPGEPELGITGFKGKITFTGNWPLGIKRTHLVAFKAPLLQEYDFFPPNLSIIIDTIAYGSREYNYNSIDNNLIADSQIEAGEYAYVVVVQSKIENLSLFREDWTVAGVYCINNDQTKPRTMVIQKDRMTKDININCDFNNPPPQPPGGK